ncbi:unnamed protein product [Ectocarpus fasciculatus]
MVRATGRPNRGSSGVAAAAAAALGAVALAVAMAGRSASAAETPSSAETATSDCTSMDLVNHNITDYIRWSNMSDRLYLENGACVTLTDIYESRSDGTENKGPLYPFDETTLSTTNTITGSWYLESSLYITEGSKLTVQGKSKGGDCDHLLLASSPEKFINLRAHGGDIMLDGTHVESWDLAARTVDENNEDGRSYLSAISEVITDSTETCDGVAKNDMGEARMDIIDSEVNHLGWYDSESYGISYKVRGFCKDLSNPELFDAVSVTGDILGSDIHDNYFGHYSYGHQGGNWSHNKMHDNIGYGFDPHDDSDYITIHNNEVYNNGWHGIIASKRCDHVSIQNNHVHDNGHINEAGQRTGNGIMLHRSSDYGTVKNNVIHDNMDSGVALYESSYCAVSDNKIYGNKNGIRMSLGSSDNLFYENDIIVNGPDANYAIYLYQGHDIPDVSDGRPRNNHIFDNSLISDNEVVKMLNSDDTAFEGNVVYGRVSRFKDSFNTLWKGNFIEDGIHDYKLELMSCFDPDSDIEEPETYEDVAALEEAETTAYSYSYSYDFDVSASGFFCA